MKYVVAAILLVGVGLIFALWPAKKPEPAPPVAVAPAPAAPAPAPSAPAAVAPPPAVPAAAPAPVAAAAHPAPAAHAPGSGSAEARDRLLQLLRDAETRGHWSSDDTMLVRRLLPQLNQQQRDE